jgi:hypothetical protein
MLVFGIAAASNMAAILHIIDQLNLNSIFAAITYYI